MKQLEIFYKIQERLLTDADVSGVLLMGSVAQGTALPESDLDIMILCGKNEFRTSFVDGVPVEYIFTTHDFRLRKLHDNDMEVYHFLNSKITYDASGKLDELMKLALEKYNNFKTKPETKAQISHWLSSARLKLIAAINSKNMAERNFITATNSWKIIEAVWAVNDKPVPPSGSVTRFKNTLSLLPSSDWFERLFSGGDALKSTAMLEMIEWALDKFNKQIN